MENPRLNTLIETLELSQNLALWYISLLKETDPYMRFETNGKEMNSLYWIVGHLAWAENLLLLEGTHGESFGDENLARFALGEKHEINEKLDFKALKSLARAVHEKAIAHLKSLKDEDLDQPNAKNFGFGQEPTNQVNIMHAIRHLGTHTGHLSWLCKLNGVKTI